MRPAEERINHKLSTCDQKMEQIRKGVEKLYERIDVLETENKELKKKA
jgi:acetolactate synthase small subunit